jgi:hypothetical protein
VRVSFQRHFLAVPGGRPVQRRFDKDIVLLLPLRKRDVVGLPNNDPNFELLRLWFFDFRDFDQFIQIEWKRLKQNLHGALTGGLSLLPELFKLGRDAYFLRKAVQLGLELRNILAELFLFVLGLVVVLELDLVQKALAFLQVVLKGEPFFNLLLAENSAINRKGLPVLEVDRGVADEVVGEPAGVSDVQREGPVAGQAGV